MSVHWFKAVVFRKIVSALSEVVEQGNFNIDDEDGINFQGMDSSHVSLVAMRLQKDAFSQWRCDNDQTIGIQFECMGSKDALSNSCSEDIDAVNFEFCSEQKTQFCNFSLKLMEIDSEQLGITDTSYKAVVNMPSTEFQRICRDLSAIGDAVTISASKQGVKFAVNGDIGKGSMWIKSSNEANIDDNDEDNEATTVSVAEPVQQQFSIKFLNNFTKATGLSQSVKISMGPDVPLEVSYDIDGVGCLRYYLAPKIDDDE